MGRNATLRQYTPIQNYMEGATRTNAVLSACQLDEQDRERMHRQRILINYGLPLLVLAALIVGFILGRMT